MIEVEFCLTGNSTSPSVELRLTIYLPNICSGSQQVLI